MLTAIHNETEEDVKDDGETNNRESEAARTEETDELVADFAEEDTQTAIESAGGDDSLGERCGGHVALLFRVDRREK
jgi:hypothetical protein